MANSRHKQKKGGEQVGSGKNSTPLGSGGGGNNGKPIFAQWWFWALVAVAAVASGGFSWWVNATAVEQVSAGNLENVTKRAYIEYQERRSNQLEEAYRADDVGGETPEETLRLFVEALEAKNFEEAAEYFIPEEEEGFKTQVQEAVESGGLDGFVNAYRNGQVVPPEGVGSSGIYEFELYEPGDSVPFLARLKKNEFTEVWKIVEL